MDIEGMGPGLIRAYNKVTMNLLFDSFHRVDFSISGGGGKESVLLRRRKLLRWNRGARFHILPGKPSPQFVEQSLADEERTLKRKARAFMSSYASLDVLSNSAIYPHDTGDNEG